MIKKDDAESIVVAKNGAVNHWLCVH